MFVAEVGYVVQPYCAYVVIPVNLRPDNLRGHGNLAPPDEEKQNQCD